MKIYCVYWCVVTTLYIFLCIDYKVSRHSESSTIQEKGGEIHKRIPLGSTCDLKTISWQDYKKEKNILKTRGELPYSW